MRGGNVDRRTNLYYLQQLLSYYQQYRDLTALHKAPLADPFFGPAILEGRAAAQATSDVPILFYSRRIGRPPQGDLPEHQHADKRERNPTLSWIAIPRARHLRADHRLRAAIA